jgi:branched-chain amino acid transport system substrate-binding protein
MRCASKLLFAAVGLTLSSLAAAQIKIGQTAGFTGPVASSIQETAEGARLYLDAIKQKGGIQGMSVDLVSLDDKFEPPIAAQNAKKLIDQGVVALFLTRGTPHSQAILPLLAEHKLPLIAPSTGAMVLHQPVNPWVFNVRATYQREAERTVKHLMLIGMERIAVVQVDDSFGADAAAGVAKGFAATDKQPVVHEKYARSKPDFSAIVRKVVASQAQAVLFIGSGREPGVPLRAFARGTDRQGGARPAARQGWHGGDPGHARRIRRCQGAGGRAAARRQGPDFRRAAASPGDDAAGGHWRPRNQLFAH